MLNFDDIFDALQHCYLVVSPNAPEFKILGVNDAYLTVTSISKEIIGRALFDVFTDNPNNPNATGVKNLTASLMKVLETGKQHAMAIQRYDTRRADGTGFDIRYWKPVNTPVLDADGGIRYIIHSVEEVTDLVLLRKDLQERDVIKQQQITEAVRTTQELERMEISQELHDNVNQILNAARLYLELARQPGTGTEEYLVQGHSLVQKAMEEVRKLSHALVHASEEEQNLSATLEELLDQVMALKKINVFKKIHLPDEALIESKVKTTLIRIVQEQLANVVKHSEAMNLYIDVSFTDNNLELTIRDDGRGFNMNDHNRGLGFQNMKSRAAMMDGSVLITSSPGDGCRIQVSLPHKRS